MAILTGRRQIVRALRQRFPVNAVTIHHARRGDGDIVLVDNFLVLMATSASFGDMVFADGGLAIFWGTDCVLAMAIRADRHIRVPLFAQGPVDTAVKLLDDIVMTLPAGLDHILPAG